MRFPLVQDANHVEYRTKTNKQATAVEVKLAVGDCAIFREKTVPESNFYVVNFSQRKHRTRFKTEFLSMVVTRYT